MGVNSDMPFYLASYGNSFLLLILTFMGTRMNIVRKIFVLHKLILTYSTNRTIRSQ